MLTTLLIAAATGLVTGLGTVPFLFRPSIPRRVYDAVLGLGAGLMLSAATLGLLEGALAHARAGGALQPDVLLQVILGFGAGVLVLVLMERHVPHQHARGHHEHISHHHEGPTGDSVHPHELEHHETVRQGVLISGAMTFHRLPEGFALGVGFASGHFETLGYVLAVAIGFQNVCEGTVMAAPLRLSGMSRLRTVLAVSATGLAVPLAAVVGHLVGASFVGVLPFAMAVAAGALITLISNEVIPETHSHGNELVASIGLALGFTITMVVRSLGHSH